MTFSLRSGYVLFCDDLRIELGNKISLMGIYGPALQISEHFPVLLPKFAIHVGLTFDIGDTPEWLIITVMLPDNEEFARIEIPSAQLQMRDGADASTTKVRFAHNTPFSPFPLTKAGYVSVWIETEIGKFRAARLKVSSLAEQEATNVANIPPTPATPDAPAPRS